MALLDILVAILETIVPFVAMFALLVGVHEWGHFRMARYLGISCTQFSIGVGRVLWSMTDRDGCEWQLRAIPLGGFVRFLGDRDATSVAPDGAGSALSPDEKRRRLLYRSPLDRALVLAAGPAANIALGLVVLAALYSGYGRPMVPPVIQSVIPGAPADVAGLRQGDRITSINGMRTDSFGDIYSEIALHPDEPVLVVYRREGVEQPVEAEITPKGVKVVTFGSAQTVGRIGITSGSAINQPTGPIDAVALGFWDVAKQTRAFIITLGQLLSGNRSIDDVGSPIRMASIAKNAAADGLSSWTFMLAVFSINLAVVNLLPLPVLDGGQLVLCAIEGAMRRPMKPQVMVYVQIFGACLLLTIMTVLTLNDLWTLIRSMAV
ncbi:M50 family metallopeptidase [Bosea sp. RAC05]|uniref:M50 family metallopeptidase n=1 Tax=Bosea sp. RAC05 TaxID=1842539 RepID=UPI00083E665E|nr:M50 family metallopeptidase [Bosea sp. RAC05]AOG03277.1 RIP metalloprotease RseP [Bosea sp. RAC05]